MFLPGIILLLFISGYFYLEYYKNIELSELEVSALQIIIMGVLLVFIILVYSYLSSTGRNTPLQKQFLDMDYKNFILSLRSDDLTLFRKQYMFDSSIGRTVRWKGTIVDVIQGSIKIRTTDDDLSAADTELFIKSDQTSELILLNKGDVIIFEGLITKKSIPGGRIREDHTPFDLRLFNGKIIHKE